MKNVVEFFQNKGIIFKSLKEIAPKALGSRKKVALYLGVNLQGYYALIMVVDKKSRVLVKEAEELMNLHPKVEALIDSKVTKKYILIHAPLCSKAKALLESKGWKVWGEG